MGFVPQGLKKDDLLNFKELLVKLFPLLFSSRAYPHSIHSAA